MLKFMCHFKWCTNSFDCIDLLNFVTKCHQCLLVVHVQCYLHLQTSQESHDDDNMRCTIEENSTTKQIR